MDFLFYVIKHHLQLSRPVNKHLDYLVIMSSSSLWSTSSFWELIAPNNCNTHGSKMADAILRQSTTPIFMYIVKCVSPSWYPGVICEIYLNRGHQWYQPGVSPDDIVSGESVCNQGSQVATSNVNLTHLGLQN